LCVYYVVIGNVGTAQPEKTYNVEQRTDFDIEIWHIELKK